MASPNAMSPPAMSPPAPTSAQIPSKKRSSLLDVNGPPGKRRKSSQAGLSHPLRQTSFPPEARSFAVRSPSVDATSHVSGSVASGVTASGAPKKKRGRKAKNAKLGEESAERTPSLAGGKASTAGGGQEGDKGAVDDDDDDEGEMALEDGPGATAEQLQEELRLRAMLTDRFDSLQYRRYEEWRAAKLSDAAVKRVVNATVSQSVPQMVSTAVKAVTKHFAGEIIERARQIQDEWMETGERQTDLPTPPAGTEIEGVATEKAAEHMRAPLRPEHLREAWRRYKMEGQSRGVGVQQLWHSQQASGVERFSSRTGKRLFK